MRPGASSMLLDEETPIREIGVRAIDLGIGNRHDLAGEPARIVDRRNHQNRARELDRSH